MALVYNGSEMETEQRLRVKHKRVQAEEFVADPEAWCVVDVRSPSEFAQAHLPGAHSVPLFSDEARAHVGLTYKQQGREAAVLVGLEWVGPNMRQLAEQLLALAQGKPLLLHCWRGGMRSEAMVWLARKVGLEVARLEGGYKAVRRCLLHHLARPRPIVILGGMTGAGKTELLHALAAAGEAVLDLEGLASHKGSSFGNLGEAPQPAQSTFENALAMVWRHLPDDRPVWIENESRCIGRRTIPPPLWGRMREAPVLHLEVPQTLRRERLLQEYGTHDLASLRDSVCRIEKRLGPQHTSAALDALDRHDLAACTDLLLEHYYDKLYQRGLERRKSRVMTLTWSKPNRTDLIPLLIEAGRELATFS